MWSQVVRTLVLLGIGLGMAAVLANWQRIREEVVYASQLFSQPSESVRYQRPAPKQLENVDDVILELRQIVASGEAQELQRIRPEVIGQFAGEAPRIERALREQALYTLISKFSQDDWEHGLDEVRANDYATRSAARLYVTDVGLANPELGAYLETAGLLLHQLYLKTQKSVAFNPTNYLETLPAATRVELAANTDFDPVSIVGDPVFSRAFERTRHKLFQRFVDAYPGNVEGQLRLLGGLNPSIEDEATSQAMRKLLLMLSTRTTSRFRLETIATADRLATLEGLVEQDTQAKKLYAKFLIMTALDSLDVGQPELSEVLYHRSLRFAEGLEVQELVRKRLEQELRELHKDPGDENASKEIGDSLFARDVEQPAAEVVDGEGFSFGPALIVFLLMGAGIFVFLKFRAREEGVNELVKEVTHSQPGEELTVPKRANL